MYVEPVVMKMLFADSPKRVYVCGKTAVTGINVERKFLFMSASPTTYSSFELQPAVWTAIIPGVLVVALHHSLTILS